MGALPHRLRVGRFLGCVVFAMAVGTGAGWAAEFKDVRIIETTKAVFPEALSRESVYDGEAKVVLVIDAEGRLADCLLRSYSHPLLARTATKALRQWRFEPAQAEGQRVDTRVELAFSFHAGGTLSVIRSPDFPERVRPTGAQEETQRIFPAHELHQPLTVLKAVRPLSVAPTKPRPAGSVTVDFYVDEEGRTRMPVVKQADDLSFAEAAVEAVRHWKFSVPLHHG